jgi:hypothetical protein
MIVGTTVRLLRRRIPIPDASQFELASLFGAEAHLISP